VRWGALVVVGIVVAACGPSRGFMRPRGRQTHCEYMGPFATFNACTQCWADRCGSKVAACYGPQWADATPGRCTDWQRCRERCGECTISGTACTKPCDDAAPACAACQKTLASCYWECGAVCFSE
jgi:hypothetical protein